jgi:hypothetical protein
MTSKQTNTNLTLPSTLSLSDDQFSSYWFYSKLDHFRATEIILQLQKGVAYNRFGIFFYYISVELEPTLQKIPFCKLDHFRTHQKTVDSLKMV